MLSARVGALALETAAGDLEQQPRRDRHGDEEGKHHRQGGVGGNGAHIGPHQTGDEQHRQQSDHDGERRDDGRIADLGDRLDRGLGQPAIAAHLPVTNDVFNDDDGVVDENADRENQREQADAVDRIAHHPRGEHRQQNGRRDDDEDDDAFAPADHQHDESDDRESGEREMKQQLVRFLGRGLAVIARDRDFEIVWNDAALGRFEPAQDFGRHHDGVGAPALGYGDAHRRPLFQRALRVARHRPAVMLWLRGADHDIGHVLHIDRTPIARGEQQQADVWNSLQCLPRHDRQRTIVLAKRAHEEGAIGVGQLIDELVQRNAVKRQARGIGFDPDLIGSAADDIAAADIIDLGQLVLKLLGDLI